MQQPEQINDISVTVGEQQLPKLLRKSIQLDKTILKINGLKPKEQTKQNEEIIHTVASRGRNTYIINNNN